MVGPFLVALAVLKTGNAVSSLAEVSANEVAMQFLAGPFASGSVGMSGGEVKLLEDRFRALDACPPEVVIEGMTLAIESAADFGVEIKKVEANMNLFDELYFAIPTANPDLPTWKKESGKYVLGFKPDMFPSEPFFPAVSSFYGFKKQYALRNPEKLPPCKERGMIHLKSPAALGTVSMGSSYLVRDFLNARGVECDFPGWDFGIAGIHVNQNDLTKAKQLIVQFFGKDPSWIHWSKQTNA